MKLIDALNLKAENLKRKIMAMDGTEICEMQWFSLSTGLNLDGYKIIEPEPEKKQGRWEYCDVIPGEYISEKSWDFIRHKNTFGLAVAFFMRGFGGIEFKEQQGRFWDVLMGVDKDGYLVVLSSEYCIYPATPHRVRFWVED
jgi:hypothetical protein